MFLILNREYDFNHNNFRKIKSFILFVIRVSIFNFC